MYDFIHLFQQKIENLKFHRVLPFCLAVLFVVLSPVQAFAYNADDIQYQNLRWQNTSTYNTHLNLSNISGTDLYNKSFSLSGSTYDESTNVYFWNTDAQYSNVYQMSFGLSGSPLTVTLLPEVYDYYFAWTVYNLNGSDVNTFSFAPDRFVVQSYNCDSSPNVYTDLIQFDYTHFDTSKSLGFTVTGKLPDNFSSSQLNRIVLFDNSGGTLPKGFYSSGVVLAINKNSSASAESLIASLLEDINDSINIQTDSIMNSGSQYQGISSDILSGNDELSGFIDDYTEIEQSMYDKFTENQSAVSGNFSGWTWGSLSTAVDWTSDYLNRIYDNSGDFRTMFMYPILAGIALIFIGRQGLAAYSRSKKRGD